MGESGGVRIGSPDVAEETWDASPSWEGALGLE
jgi:hypothetical protein